MKIKQGSCNTIVLTSEHKTIDISSGTSCFLTQILSIEMSLVDHNTTGFLFKFWHTEFGHNENSVDLSELGSFNATEDVFLRSLQYI